MLNKLKRLLIYLENRELLIARIKKLPLGFVENLLEVRRLLTDIDIVIDIGANDGEFIRAANYVYPKATIFAFEPLPDKYDILKCLFKNQKINGSVYSIALSDKKGKSSFYKYKFDRLSSFYKPTESLEKLFNHDAEYEKITVETDLFDNIIKLKNGKNTLVKIDTQGAEFEVLKGMEKNFQNISGIIIEVNFDYLYQGQANFVKIFEFLHKNGFNRFFQLDKGVVNNRIVWCDLLFTK